MLTRNKPMNRGTRGLARTSFKPKAPTRGKQAVTRDQLIEERAARTMAGVTPRPRSAVVAGFSTITFPTPTGDWGEVLEVWMHAPKEKALRSTTYRRLVAALPCAHCGVAGYSQHAHENADKGKSLKTDDRRGFPLCCTRPGEEGCHVAFDQYRLLPGGREAHREQGAKWAAETRALVMKSGRWPKKLPLWKEAADASHA